MVEINLWSEVLAVIAVEMWFALTSVADEIKFFRLRPALGNTVRLAVFFLGGAFFIWYLEAPLVGFAFAFLFVGVLNDQWFRHYIRTYSH